MRAGEKCGRGLPLAVAPFAKVLLSACVPNLVVRGGWADFCVCFCNRRRPTEFFAGSKQPWRKQYLAVRKVAWAERGGVLPEACRVVWIGQIDRKTGSIRKDEEMRTVGNILFQGRHGLGLRFPCGAPDGGFL